MNSRLISLFLLVSVTLPLPLGAASLSDGDRELIFMGIVGSLSRNNQKPLFDREALRYFLSIDTTAEMTGDREREIGEVARLLVREAWRKRYLTHVQNGCATEYLRQHPETSTANREFVASLQARTAKVDQLFGRLDEFESELQSDRVRESPYESEMDADWFDPLGAVRTWGEALCVGAVKTMAGQDGADSYSVLLQFTKNISDLPSDWRDASILRFLKGFSGQAEEHLRDLPGRTKMAVVTTWEFWQGRAYFLKAVMTEDPLAQEAWSEMWDSRAERLVPWLSDPETQVREIGQEILSLQPEEIGRMTVAVWEAILFYEVQKSFMERAPVVAKGFRGRRKARRTLAVENQELKIQVKELRRKLDTDPLTQVQSRAAFDEQILNAAMSGSLPSQGPLTIVIVDGRDLKAVNDLLHLSAGDEMIRAMADGIRSGLIALRRNDRVFRYGGDEFVIVLENTTLQEAPKVIDRLRQAVAEIPTRKTLVEKLKAAMSKATPEEIAKAFRGKVPQPEKVGILNAGAAEASAEKPIRKAFEEASGELNEAKKRTLKE